MNTKTITLVIDEDFGDLITITAIGKGKHGQTNVNISADMIEDGMVISLPKKREDGEGYVND